MTDQSKLVNVDDLEWNLETVGGHNYRALLYDAKMGVTVSQLKIYQAFTGMVKRGQQPPMDMMRFVAGQIDAVLTERQTAKAMFNKSGKKLPTSSPRYWQLVEISRTGIDGDIHAAFEHVSDMLGGRPSPSQVRDHYYREAARLQRIGTVGELLGEYDSVLAIPRSQRTLAHRERLKEIDDKLADIYRSPAGLA